MSQMVVQSLAAFFSTLFAIIAFAPLAARLKLIDLPDHRKQHLGHTPLIGGIAIYSSFVIGAVIWGSTDSALVIVRDENALTTLLLCSGALVFTGALDDRFQLAVTLRIATEVLVAIFAIELLDIRLVSLGDLFGLGEVRMPQTLSYMFTITAIFGVINAFNMLDGIDGLLAALVFTTVLAFHLFNTTAPGLISMFLLSSIGAFLISNMGLSPWIPKVFLGDAGSKLLGFVVVFLVLAAASGQVGTGKLIKPVTALFLLTVPLCDMVYTALRRLLNGGSPFRADRSHLHHLMLALGFSHLRALVIIVTFNVAATGLGLLLHRLDAPDHYQLAVFLGCFAFYCFLASHSWLVANELGSMKQEAAIESVYFSQELKVPEGSAERGPDADSNITSINKRPSNN